MKNPSIRKQGTPNLLEVWIKNIALPCTMCNYFFEIKIYRTSSLVKLQKMSFIRVSMWYYKECILINILLSCFQIIRVNGIHEYIYLRKAWVMRNKRQNTKCIVYPPCHVVKNLFALYFSLILSNIAMM